jgi:hypothetical protein
MPVLDFNFNFTSEWTDTHHLHFCIHRSKSKVIESDEISPQARPNPLLARLPMLPLPPRYNTLMQVSAVTTIILASTRRLRSNELRLLEIYVFTQVLHKLWCGASREQIRAVADVRLGKLGVCDAYLDKAFAFAINRKGGVKSPAMFTTFWSVRPEQLYGLHKLPPFFLCYQSLSNHVSQCFFVCHLISRAIHKSDFRSDR